MADKPYLAVRSEFVVEMRMRAFELACTRPAVERGAATPDKVATANLEWLLRGTTVTDAVTGEEGS